MRPLDLPTAIPIPWRVGFAVVDVEENQNVPGPPEDVMATGSEGGVTVEWSAPLDPGTSPVAGYEVLIDELGVAVQVGPEARSVVVPATSHSLPILTLP